MTMQELEDAIDVGIELAPLCLLVDFPDLDIIGPFASAKETKLFMAKYPERCKDADIRVMISPEIERLCGLRENGLKEIRRRVDQAARRELGRLRREVFGPDA
jgi:hypothetical protein